MRPVGAIALIIGMSLALVLQVVMRAGFISVTATSSDLNVCGIAAVAALTGLFSKQAADKLNEVSTAAFRTAPGSVDLVVRNTDPCGQSASQKIEVKV